jgi:pentatricopeptide repeat protein
MLRVHVYLRFGLADDAHLVFDELADPGVIVWNSMANGFAKLRYFDRAVECFRKMREEGVVEMWPDAVTVAAALPAYCSTEGWEGGAGVHRNECTES